MKITTSVAVAAALLFICISLVSPIHAEDKSTGAKAQTSSAHGVAAFPETKYKFDAVMEGTEVVHDFVVKNNGDATLEITNVRPG